MTDKDPRRFVFNGHAVGVGAHFHRLEQHTGLNLNVPMLGASVLPVTGGVSESKASNFCYEVDKPIRKRLLSVRQVDTRAHGYVKGKTYHTDVETRVEHSRWADLVHFDLLSLKMETTHDGAEGPPHIFLKDLHIEGLCLGSVKANVEVDEEPFSSCGTMESIEHFWAKQSDRYRRENAARFPVDPADPKKLKKFRGSYICSIVRNITLSGREKELGLNEPVGNKIVWDDPKNHKIGFGKIVLGEVLISGSDRRITLARLQMGCPVGGSGSGGEGHTNGSPGT